MENLDTEFTIERVSNGFLLIKNGEIMILPSGEIEMIKELYLTCFEFITKFKVGETKNIQLKITSNH
jgi:hypothetical protein